MIDPARLVFVGGLHRSGTTLFAKLLTGHPDVSGLSNTGVWEDEGQHLQDVYPPAAEFGGLGRFAFADGAHMTEDERRIPNGVANGCFARGSRIGTRAVLS